MHAEGQCNSGTLWSPSYVEHCLVGGVGAASLLEALQAVTLVGGACFYRRAPPREVLIGMDFNERDPISWDRTAAALRGTLKFA